MNIKQRIKNARAAANQSCNKPAEVRLKRLWTNMYALEEALRDIDDDHELEGAVVDAETPIMRAACDIRADTLMGVFYKFAICRMDWTELDDKEPTRYERLGLSTFMDLVAFLREESMLTEHEKETLQQITVTRRQGYGEAPDHAYQNIKAA